MATLKNDCMPVKMANKSHCYFSVDHSGVAMLAYAVSWRFWRGWWAFLAWGDMLFRWQLKPLGGKRKPPEALTFGGCI